MEHEDQYNVWSLGSSLWLGKGLFFHTDINVHLQMQKPASKLDKNKSILTLDVHV